MRIRNRLPFAVDLIALTMEAGGGFQECLATAVAENGKDHPLTEEFAEVLRQISLGRPRNEALQSLDDRLATMTSRKWYSPSTRARSSARP